MTVAVTVRSRDGRFRTDIGEDDFILTVDDLPVPISALAKVVRPLRLVLMIDLSDSMVSRFASIRRFANSLVDALATEDLLRIGSFGEEVFLSPHFTNDRQLLSRILSDELWPGGHSPLREALKRSAASLTEAVGERTVLVVSDGGASPVLSELRFGAGLVELARANAVRIYGVNLARKGVGAVKELADATRGGYASIPEAADFGDNAREILAELKCTYAIGFLSPVRDGKTHRLAVGVIDQSLSVFGPSSFVAPSERR